MERAEETRAKGGARARARDHFSAPMFPRYGRARARVERGMRSSATIARRKRADLSPRTRFTRRAEIEIRKGSIFLRLTFAEVRIILFPSRTSSFPPPSPRRDKSIDSEPTVGVRSIKFLCPPLSLRCVRTQ